MDVYNDGKRIVGRDRAIDQNPDRFGAKRTLDVDLARRDVGQVWCRKRSSAMRAHQRDAASRFRRSATPVATRERIAQFGVDKIDCAHGWQPRPFGGKTVWQRLPGDKSALISHID